MKSLQQTNMRNAFHTAAFKETTAAFGKTVTAVVAGTAEENAVAAFWEGDKKPEELRAALLRGAFHVACAKGEGPAAEYMLQKYPQHLSVAELKKSALAAVAAGHDRLALYLTEKTVAAGDRKNAARAVEIIAAEAFEKGSADLINGLLSILPETNSAHLYRTALGNKPANMDLLLAHCRARNTLSQEDLDRTLVIAVKNKNISMAQVLLATGADADGSRKAPLKQLAGWAETDPTAAADLLTTLLSANADPLLATEIFPAIWHPLIEKTAEKTQQQHFEILQQRAEKTVLDVSVLRAVRMPDGMTGLHYAAKYRVLDRLPLAGMTVADLDTTNANGATLTETIERSGAWRTLLHPPKWTGQKHVLQHFVTGLGEKAREKIDLAALLHDVDMQTLRGRARGLRLKPKGF